jgi:hypothetical protein
MVAKKAVTAGCRPRTPRTRSTRSPKRLKTAAARTTYAFPGSDENTVRVEYPKNKALKDSTSWALMRPVASIEWAATERRLRSKTIPKNGLYIAYAIPMAVAAAHSLVLSLQISTGEP